MTSELITLLYGRQIGVVQRGRNARLRFSYDDEWRAARDATPLSLSLPLAAREHGHVAVEAFLWNLLPDNERILEAWGRRFQVSARNVLALMTHIGEDCAGAVQLVRPDRLEGLAQQTRPQVQWLDEAGVAGRLRELRRDHAAWRRSGDAGQFSLAGAQPKTALLHEEGRWGVPSGRTPTTHILKPPIADLEGHAENEHLCLSLAREVGLPAVHSYVGRFEDEVAIVVERYDRAWTARLAAQAAAEAAAAAAAASAAADEVAANAASRSAEAAARAAAMSELAGTQPILRLHQEDTCQAMGLRPTFKYQNEGGPSPSDVVSLLREHSSQPQGDVKAFVGALAFNWFVGGTDAHAKNYSLLHASRHRVRLAPLYDIASALPYAETQPQKLRLAMKIGDQYRLGRIGRAQWEKLASEIDLDPRPMWGEIVELGTRIAERITHVCQEAREAGLTDPIVERLECSVRARVDACLSG